MGKKIFLSNGEDLKEALFQDRPNRFVVRCLLEEDIVLAHLRDPGRLKELLVQGRRIWLQKVKNPKRKTDWTASLVEDPEGLGFVSIDSTLPNRLIKSALEEKALDELKGWSLVRPEFTKGSSRFDFLLKDKKEGQMALEVKSVTLVKGDLGLFPDAVTARGARHVRELTQLVKETGWKAAILFVLQRGDATRIKAHKEMDPVFAEALLEAKEKGVLIFGRRCTIDLKGITLGSKIPLEW